VAASTDASVVARREAALERGGGRGAHYTPRPLAERMARAVLGPVCHGRSPEGILGLRVLDPAVGSGRFLAAALDVLAEATGCPARFRRAIAAQCLYGVDIDAGAVELARGVVAGASECDAEAVAAHIVVGDSLLADLPGLFGIGGFDAVLGNPPWISFSGRQAGRLSRRRRCALARRFRSFGRWPTTHGAFLELTALVLRPGGRAALVLPHQVCHLPGYEAARRAARAHCRFAPPPEPLGEGVFPGVVQPAAIVHLHRCPAGDAGRGPAVVVASRSPESGILRRLERHPAAPPRTFRDPGVHTGNSARLILHAGPGPGRVPVREGRCLRAFALRPARQWVDLEPRLPEGHYCRLGSAAVYRDVPILVRQTASRPIAARHAEPGPFRNSLLGCVGIAGLDDAVLVALLNSTLLAFYHRCAHADSRQRAFPQVKVGHLQALPIARDAAALRPIAVRIEGLEAERDRLEDGLRHRLCGVLGCTWEELEPPRGSTLVGWLAREGAERALARRVPSSRPALEAVGTVRFVEGVVGAVRRQMGGADAAVAEAWRGLDQRVFEVYGLGERDARAIADRVVGDG